jgi:hypothetical protein
VWSESNLQRQRSCAKAERDSTTLNSYPRSGSGSTTPAFFDRASGLPLFKVILLACVLTSFAPEANAFSLLGPLKNRANQAADPWQGKPFAERLMGLGYELSGDIGGPMFSDEAYRWNVPVVYYGFDSSFVDYFGQAGVDAVEQAIAILNALPSASEMSLDEFPFDTKGENAFAATLSLFDLKSTTLPLLLEQLGLANPERFVWGLRERTVEPSATNYVVVRLNYDPMTFEPSSYVNGVLYQYEIFDALGTAGAEWASAVEWYRLDPLYQPYSSVAGGLPHSDFQLGSSPLGSSSSGLGIGQYISGLTRDDAGGLRFLLSSKYVKWETLLPGVTGTGGDPGQFVNAARRPGVEKLNFTRLNLDSNTGVFQPVTNTFPDTYFAEDVAATQNLQRIVRTPDVLFRARDLGASVGYFQGEAYFVPFLVERTGTGQWSNHAALNGQPQRGGPGVIQPPAVITYNKLDRYAAAAGWNRSPESLQLLQWGSFDGSADPPQSYSGSETNLQSLVLETRLVVTNDAPYVQWATLGHWNARYRIEASTNLVDWLPVDTIFNLTSQGVFTVRRPATQPRQFFRSVKE